MGLGSGGDYVNEQVFMLGEDWRIFWYTGWRLSEWMVSGGGLEVLLCMQERETESLLCWDQKKSTGLSVKEICYCFKGQ